jgi:hypothetical protein
VPCAADDAVAPRLSAARRGEVIIADGSTAACNLCGGYCTKAGVRPGRVAPDAQYDWASTKLAEENTTCRLVIAPTPSRVGLPLAQVAWPLVSE